MPTASKNYVVGFAFDELNRVWLIKKLRPSWQAGLLNGIGGQVEEGETPVQAMTREFNEEAGLPIEPLRWNMFHCEIWPNGKQLYFFTTRLESYEIPRTMTDEELVLLTWTHIGYLEWSFRGVMYNMHYLIPMAHVWLTKKPAELHYHKL